MPFPASLRFYGDMHVVRYSPDDGLVMERAHQSRSSLLFGLFFSVGLMVVGVWLFWGKAYEHHLAGRFTWVDVVLVVLGLASVLFGGMVSLPLAGRLLPRRLFTSHKPPVLVLRRLRARAWGPADARLLRIRGRRFTRRMDSTTVASRFVASLVIIRASGRENLLLQTTPQPDFQVAYADIYPFGRYFGELLGVPLVYTDSWQTEKAIPAPKPGEV